MPTNKEVANLKINTLKKKKYEDLFKKSELNEDELYFVVDNNEKTEYGDLYGNIENQKDLDNALYASRLHLKDMSNDERSYKIVYNLNDKKEFNNIFNVVGNPTIDKNGMATGFPFNSETYLEIFKNNEFDFSKPWQMNLKIIPGTLPDSQKRAHWFVSALSSKTRNIVLGIEGVNRVLKVYLSNNGTAFFANGIVGTAKFDSGTEYFIRVIYNLNNYKIQYSLDGVNYITDILIENNTPIYNGGLKLGDNESNTNGFRDGIIDLKYFSLKDNEGIKYAGYIQQKDIHMLPSGEVIEIPYILSKDGIKIVDIAYKKYVDLLYKQTGKGNYIIIDEEKKEFRLPLPDIYSLLEQKAAVITFRKWEEE